MNKATMLVFGITAALATIPNAFMKGFGAASYRSNTPGISSGGHGRRARTKVPNDGRWHMKHHRNRA